MSKRKTFIIAEIGVNHNNNMSIARKIISFCSKLKIDAVKFQTYKTELLANKFTPKVQYQKKNTKNGESHFTMLKNLELSKRNHKELKNFCDKKKIEFISTPYDIESAKFLETLNLKTFKVASADLTDHFLHRYLSKLNKKIIISTGMSTLDQISKTLKIYNNKKKLTLLHCVSNYPCKLDSLNMNILDELKNFKTSIGFSDHSPGFLASIIAIAKGAKIIEKHITLDNNLPGPDHKASLNLQDFKIFVEKIRLTETILGDNNKKIQSEEKEMLRISRKGLYYNSDFKKGKKIQTNDLISLRPYNGFGVDKFPMIKNKKLSINAKKGKSVKLNHFKFI